MLRADKKRSRISNIDRYADARKQPALVLPALETFTPDELMAARVYIGVARGGGAMMRGRILESHVARLLDAEFPCLGISPWDLRLADGTLIEVRSGSKKFALAGGKQVDVWIFISTSLSATYIVAPAPEIAALHARRRFLDLESARGLFGAVDDRGLAARVKLVARTVRRR